MKMRVPHLALLAVQAACASALGQLGFAIGFNTASGACKQQSDFESDFDALKGVTSLVRTYSVSSCNAGAAIVAAAKAKGFKVVLGVWPDSEDSYNADKQALQIVLGDSSNADAVYGVTVGSEALYRGDMTAQELLSKINDIKTTFPSVKKVGFADTWNKFADGTADPLIKGGVDFIMANGFSFWQAQTTSNASHSYLDDMFQAFAHIQDVAGNTDIEIWNGETGWPSDGGTNYPPAIAGTQNAETFFATGVCAALRWGFNVFYFEAFDEPSKAPATGSNGLTVDETHWGAFDANRNLKYKVSC